MCVDRNGDGKYGIYVANYGGPTRFYELKKGNIVDQAPLLNIKQNYWWKSSCCRPHLK